MEVSVLGPVGVSLGRAPVDLGTPKQRALVAALALSHGRPVSVDAIIDLLWGDAPPAAVTATLQGYVSQLRRVLEPDRARRAPATVLVTVAPGYALRTPVDAVDAARFERAVTDVHRSLQGSGDPLEPARLPAADLEHAATTLDEALALWRGTPYGELGDADAAVAERARLEELRLLAQEDRAAVGLGLGQHAALVAELEALTSAHPLRERLWALRALALARTGRQADALDVLGQVRHLLDEELGLEPTAELRELQTAVLRQDTRLEWAPPERAAPVAAPVAAPAGSAAPPEPEEQVAPWPMAGRDADLAALTELLDRAESGVPSYAVLTGEPGIGKSRLAAELLLRARRRGTRVLVGRCSQDDGAPPLWPWRSVLDALGVSLLEDGPVDEGEGGQFRAWERITTAVRSAAADEPLVVVLDDLHWADTSTLRVLRLLVESTDAARLLVLVTWRLHPEPAGALADAAEALARMHALRIQLGGLRPEDVAAVFAGVTERELDPGEAERLRARTDGNPFFLVELARLAGARGAGGAELPTAVTDVLNRRLGQLPDDTVTVLRTAAVIGREFDTPTLALVTGVDEDDLLDVVEPAQAAGLVREDGIDQYRFAHALVRDTLRSGMNVSRLARAHARVAEALTGVPGRETEVAQHWREAGPSYGDRAWRAALEAAALARHLYAYDQAAELLESALVSLEHDAQAGLRERYEVLTALMEAYRWAAQLPDLVATVEQAIVVGERLGDAEAVARAAIATTEGVLWRSGPPGSVNDTVVGALRASLDALPGDDSDLRCRTMLSLANELAEAASYDERRALCDEGLAMARRLADPSLLVQACLVSFVALWMPRTAEERAAWSAEAMELATTTGQERIFVVAACLHAVVLGELGRPEQMWPAVAVARAAAEELRIAYAEVVLDGLAVPWLAMAGRFEECEAALEHLRTVGRRLTHSTAEELHVAAVLVLRLWQGRSLEMVPVLEQLDSQFYPFSASIAVYLWRAGEHDRARAVHAERGAPLDVDSDLAVIAWSHGAELALYVGDPGLAAATYERLAPLAGRSTCAGSALALGPVDSFLALAAAAAGEREVAARHADDALRLCAAWGLPMVAEWLEQARAAYDF